MYYQVRIFPKITFTPRNEPLLLLYGYNAEEEVMFGKPMLIIFSIHVAIKQRKSKHPSSGSMHKHQFTVMITAIRLTASPLFKLVWKSLHPRVSFKIEKKRRSVERISPPRSSSPPELENQATVIYTSSICLVKTRAFNSQKLIMWKKIMFMALAEILWMVLLQIQTRSLLGPFPVYSSSFGESIRYFYIILYRDNPTSQHAVVKIGLCWQT